MVITPSYPPVRGGVQIFVQRIVENWPGEPPTVVTVGGASERRYDASQRGDVLRVLPARHGGVPVTMVALTGRVIGRAAVEKPDIVLSAHVSASPAAVALSLVGVPFIQFLYGTEMRRRVTSTRVAIRRATRVLVISRYTAELAEELGAVSSQLELIAPGVDLPNVCPNLRADRPTIVTVARIDDLHKGHDVMLEAVVRLRRDIPNIHWVVIGEGKLRGDFERQSVDLGLVNNVTFLGAATNEERDEWLDRATVFAMPSRPEPDGAVEGYGIVYIEAGAHGLPVVGGDFAGPRDAVNQDETGLLVDPTDSSHVAAAILLLLKDPELRRRMGRAGQEKARAQSWQKVAQRLESVAQRIIVDKSAGIVRSSVS
jgi:phosphatidyl-myo-inositol dimannoside synthase